MSETLAVVRLHKNSGVPADDSQMGFAFESLLPQTDALFDAIRDGLHDFFTGNTGGSFNPLCHFLSNCVNNTVGGDIDLYNLSAHLDGSPHGSPIATRHLDLSTVNTQVLPNEVAICLSFHSAYGADVEFGAGHTRPRARDRGRVFIGPLGYTDVVAQDPTNDEPLVADHCTHDIAIHAGRLLAQPDIGWSVWSRTKASLEPVTGGWVDNAFDTQRRRGNRASARTTF